VSESKTTDAATVQGQAVFHLTGSRAAADLEPIEDGRFRPALLAGYRDLTSLRYDFPVVLVEDGADVVRSLSSAVDESLREVAPRGIEGERLRRQVLSLERELRVLVRDGAKGMLSDVWERAVSSLEPGGDETTGPILRHAGEQLHVDGEVVDCDHDVGARLVEHVWRRTQQRKAQRFHEEVHRLVQALSDILRAAFIHSEGGRLPESLKAGVGDLHHDQFDFETMSRLLAKGVPEDELPPERRARIEWALEVLRQQRFFEPPEGAGIAATTAAPYEFRFASCGEMLEAFRERLPEVVEFVKAMSIADLEADGRYVETKHDPFFEGFGEDALTPQDLALFPDYLVTIDSGHADATESGVLMEVLSSDLPVKVLVQTEDVLEESSIGAGHFGFGMRSAQLASTAMGLHDVFVLQTTSSNLYQLRDRLLRGLEYAGPALFSVFTGSHDAASDLPPYLTAAAAMESRAFVAFTYDPSAGPDLASRFSLEDNPQPELDWPVEDFEYADESLQRVKEQVPFTVVDFVVCDRRYARHFARVPRSGWNESTIPVDEWLALDPGDVGERIPHVVVVDEDDVLHRLIVDAKLMQAARRCREIWHGLQELGGIHNSHAERLLERERAAWEEQKERELASVRAEAAPAAVVVEPPAGTAPPIVLGEPLPTEEAPSPEAATAVAEVVEPVAEEAPPPLGDPWIETSRCSTCNECTALNDRMFAYDENKQAYFKDMDAGTYREIVEAAEACQVAVIHPGLPRNPNEPGLEELIERAKPFQ
jgi:hypothetical protein